MPFQHGVQGAAVYYRLAQQGYIVLAYDQVGFGLRLPEGTRFYDEHPHWSRLGRMVHEARSAVDFVMDGQGDMALEDGDLVPNLDKKRVYLLGFAMGAKVALHTAALDDRVAGVAAFAGFTPLRTEGDMRATGGLERYWQWHSLVPKLGLFQDDPARVPYDYDDLLRLIAPRPLLVVAPQRDRNHPVDAVRRTVEQARSAWPDEQQHLTFATPDDVSRFQADQHRMVHEWLQSLSD